MAMKQKPKAQTKIILVGININHDNAQKQGKFKDKYLKLNILKQNYVKELQRGQIKPRVSKRKERMIRAEVSEIETGKQQKGLTKLRVESLKR